jgi:RNAse (barnase) inhibitor barstar
MKIDFKTLNTKEKFLQYMQENLEDMYSLNYDALIDAITSYKNLELELININEYKDLKNLLDIIDILKNDYPYISIKK